MSDITVSNDVDVMLRSADKTSIRNNVFGDFTSTSRSVGASALDPIQNNQPGTNLDTVANLCVDTAGNVVRGSQEATWTFNNTQLNALTATRINLLDSPGADKCVVVEETNWLIEVDLTKAYQATNVNLKCEMLGVNENSVATQITAANLNQVAQILKTANTNSFGLYIIVMFQTLQEFIDLMFL